MRTVAFCFVIAVSLTLSIALHADPSGNKRNVPKARTDGGHGSPTLSAEAEKKERKEDPKQEENCKDDKYLGLENRLKDRMRHLLIKKNPKLNKEAIENALEKDLGCMQADFMFYLMSCLEENYFKFVDDPASTTLPKADFSKKDRDSMKDTYKCFGEDMPTLLDGAMKKIHIR